MLRVSELCSLMEPFDASCYSRGVWRKTLVKSSALNSALLLHCQGAEQRIQIFNPFQVFSMPISRPPSPTSDSSSRATHAADPTSQGAAPTRPNSAATEASLEGDDARLVGTTGVNTTLELGRQQSIQDVDLALPQNIEQPFLPEEMERRISGGQAGLMHAVSQEMSQEGLERVGDFFVHMMLTNLTGLEALIAMEQMALAELLALWGGGVLPLSQNFAHQTTPNGELVFRLTGDPAAEPGNWQERFHALDELILRLVGTTGAAQTFRNGQRIGELRDILARTADREGRRIEAQVVAVDGKPIASRVEGRAERALRILDGHIEAGFNQADLWVQVARLEEVVLELLGFTPLRRSFEVAPDPVRAEAPLEVIAG